MQSTKERNEYMREWYAKNKVEDSKELLARAIEYLEHYEIS